MLPKAVYKFPLCLRGGPNRPNVPSSVIIRIGFRGIFYYNYDKEPEEIFLVITQDPIAYIHSTFNRTLLKPVMRLLLVKQGPTKAMCAVHSNSDGMLLQVLLGQGAELCQPDTSGPCISQH